LYGPMTRLNAAFVLLLLLLPWFESGCARHRIDARGFELYDDTPPTPEAVQRMVERQQRATRHDLDKLESGGQGEVSYQRKKVEREQIRWQRDGDKIAAKIIDKQLAEAQKRHANNPSSQQMAQPSALPSGSPLAPHPPPAKTAATASASQARDSRGGPEPLGPQPVPPEEALRQADRP
jgi:hypothetical protein